MEALEEELQGKEKGYKFDFYAEPEKGFGPYSAQSVLRGAFRDSLGHVVAYLLLERALHAAYVGYHLRVCEVSRRKHQERS